MDRRFLVLVGCIAAVLVTALPATANNVPETGTTINLFAPPATFAANTPFNIEQGFRCSPGVGVNDCVNARTNFDLYLDGAAQRSRVDISFLDGFLAAWNLTNYPVGLPPGSHTFVGVFTANGTVVITLTVTITFT
jgi:hypothetical protein